MADILLDEQSASASPAAGQHVLWPDSATSTLCSRDDSGRVIGIARNYSTADQLLGTGDTYVTGSRILIPSIGLQVGSRVRFRFSVVKTAAGVATPIYNIRLGTAGSVADTSVWTHTGTAQTAVAETGWFEFSFVVRTLGAAATSHGALVVTRTGGTAATGLAAVPVFQGTGTAFSSAWGAGQGLGLSVNAGAASAWTVHQVHTDLDI